MTKKRWLAVLVVLGCGTEHPTVLGAGTTNVVDGGVVGAKDASTTAPKDAGASDGAATRDAVLADLDHPTELQASATRLVWFRNDPVSGALLSAPIAGGAVTTLATGMVAAASLRLDDTAAYFLVGGPAPAVTKVALTGGPMVSLYGASAPSPLRAIALDGTDVYFTDGARLARVSKSGGAATKIAGGLAAPTSVAVDGDRAWVVESGDEGAIVEVILADGTTTTIADEQPGPREVTVTPDAIYWIDDGVFDPQTQATKGAAILRRARSGGLPTVVATGFTEHLAVVGTTLYAARGGAVVRFDASAVPLSAATTPVGLSAHGAFLYWTEPGTSERAFLDGAILKVAR
jgi:hypothetical protein